MISDAVRLIADELGTYIELDPRAGFNSNDLVLDNIADLENDRDRFLSKVIMTLVNVEEESTLKNGMHYVKNSATGGINYKEPPVFVNLYILFCATYDSTGAQYELALHRLSLIIQFFQSKRIFTVHNSPGSSVSTATSLSNEEKNELRILLELYTLTFEQINHLWGSLGGKQVPSVMYKARLVKVEGKISQEGPAIEEIQETGKAPYPFK